MSTFKMTMTRTYIICILWMAVFLDMSDTVNGSQREASKQQPQQQQQQTTTKDTASQGILPGGGGSSSSSSGSSRNSNAEPTDATRTGPYFDLSASKNVTALLGKTAYLNCRVKNLGNKTMLLQVSWVRHRDIHLLTVGRYTYTSDQRFRAIHHPHTEDWSLQIKYPQHRDSGIYECQISTTPHMSHFVHLNVIEPSTEIIGAPDLYIESGSTINLTCVVKDSPEPPAYIFWNHNNVIISYDSPRGGVSVITEKGDTTTSFLLIQSARPSDSGQYTCNPSNAKSKSVTVHVLNGVSHSVSRGVPSSNAARGPTASSHATASSAFGVSVCFYIVASVLQAGHRTRNACPDVASFLDAYATLVIRPFLLLTHTIYRILINQITKFNHRQGCNIGSSIRSQLVLLVTLVVSFQPLTVLSFRSLQQTVSSLSQRWQHSHCRRISSLGLLVKSVLLRRTMDTITRILRVVLLNLNGHTFEFVLNHLWNQRFAVR
ncbi:uncharacterized protein LOC110679012 isoform X1 [Aedes aegypti]|uniref:Ig-like domain-containing protein n=1 Tax=Aedes aegypti TaxID=7159 RepID=A0A6I8TUJ8_AEDAE|nr:uncharacterized protein LOC110679012 isoform X1 [Aedes aegypti]XP_021708569.1 uncharacterized protein LOC110679012 isoform X1 [Aedes aegypti]XP_021708570.1 uncharacterized protein LOC110679012 isoform X1 [Aedes aegypti]